MTPPDAQVTTELLAGATVVVGAVDLLFGWLLTRSVSAERFRRLRGPVALFAFLLWFELWAYLAAYRYWAEVYSYVFPAWARWLLPPLQGALSAAAALGAWWLAARSPRHPVPRFVLLGGAWGVLTHVYAVHRGVMSRPPMLQGASPVAAIVFAATEFAFYFCVVLTASALWDRLRRRTR